MASTASGRLPPAGAPQRLHRLIMRRAAWVALPVLLAALLLGALRMADDVAEEVDAAASLALAMAELGRLGASTPVSDDGAAVLDSLLQLQRSRPLRHLRLQVADETGRLLLPPAPEPAASSGLLAAWPRWFAPATAVPQVVSWPVPRPGGGHWTVTLTTSPEAERREALHSLIEHLGLLLALVLGLLLVMRANLVRALAPLTRLVAAIAGIERADTGPVRALPPMPVAELDALAGALRHLGTALDEAEQARRRLARQVQSLQEDERARLARELHDEFGQRLTALRVDAAWLARRLAGPPSSSPTLPPAEAAAPPPPPPWEAEAAALAEDMSRRCGALMQDIRQLLRRLQPFDSLHDPLSAEPPLGVPVGQLAALLDDLVTAWRSPGRGPAISARWAWREPQAVATVAARPWQALGELALPRGFALALYRITQEALTNIARHAVAERVEVEVVLEGAACAGAALQVRWRVADDGRGLGDPAAAVRRGSGLAGLRERVWAEGGELQLGPWPGGPGESASPAAGRPGTGTGTCLAATWRLNWCAAAEGATAGALPPADPAAPPGQAGAQTGPGGDQ